MKKISGPMIVTALGVAVGLILIYFAADSGKTPKYENDEERAALAQCLTDNGVAFFGAWWCSNCDKQKAAFGGAIEYVDYIECSTQDRKVTPECESEGIEGYPTWDFGEGKERLVGVRSLTQLAKAAECPYGDYIPEGLESEPLIIESEDVQPSPAEQASGE